MLKNLYIICKPHSNHKRKACSKYTKDYDKEVKAYYHRKSSNHNGRQQEMKQGTKYLQKRQKTINKMSRVSSIYQ